MKYITVVGAGYVGLIAAVCLANDGQNVICVEINQEKLTQLRNGNAPFYEKNIDILLQQALEDKRIFFTDNLEEGLASELIIIAVGTPSTNEGGLDLSSVNEVVEKISLKAVKDSIIVMKSTVPPGTGSLLLKRYLSKSKFELTYLANPEFLREGQAVNDWYQTDRIVIGGHDEAAIEKLKALYKNVHAPVMVMDITSAEMVKYASNAFLAAKISFINEIANICELVGADVTKVSDGMGYDKRIGKEFLRAGIGYGGSCFPKDTKGLEFLSSYNGYNFKMLEAVIEVNRYQKLKVVKELKKVLGDLFKKKIIILGLTFKPGTDDLRESPAVDVLNILLNEGAEIKAYDPMVKANHEVIDKRVEILNSLHMEAFNGIDIVIIATEWPEFLLLDWELVSERMNKPALVFDGRNFIKDISFNKQDFHYKGIGICSK